MKTIAKNAILSEDKEHRYYLSRVWDESKGLVMFLMLNPSTADADNDDNTIRRCMGFAKSWDYGGILVGNLFSFRTKDPKKLIASKQPVRHVNIVHLKEMAMSCDKVICAWGNEKTVKKIMDDLRPFYNPLRHIQNNLYCLQLSVNGIPKHPLFLKKDLEPKKLIEPVKL